MNNLPRSVLVMGGTGFVGRHVCEKLCRSGWHVTVPTRRAHTARHIQHLPGLSVVEADVHNPVALARLLAGHQAVVQLVAILHGNEHAFDQVHVQLPARLVAACQSSDVRRVVHVSALGVAPDAPSMYQRSKARGEAALKAGGLDLTLLRPSVIFGADDHFLNLFAAMQRWLPFVPLAGARAQFQPVWVEDVAEAVVRCLAQPATAGKTYECAGPEVLTLEDIVRLAGKSSGHPRPVIEIADDVGRAQAWLMEHLPGPPLMSRDNLDAMKTPNVASGEFPGLRALGIEPASLAAVAPGYLGNDRDAAEGWRRQSGSTPPV